MMEKHKEILLKTCHLCGRICRKGSISKATMREPLLNIFDIHIENDSGKLHGAIICETHQGLLRKQTAAAKRGKVMTLDFHSL